MDSGHSGMMLGIWESHIVITALAGKQKFFFQILTFRLCTELDSPFQVLNLFKLLQIFSTFVPLHSTLMKCKIQVEKSSTDFQ